MLRMRRVALTGAGTLALCDHHNAGYKCIMSVAPLPAPVNKTKIGNRKHGKPWHAEETQLRLGYVGGWRPSGRGKQGEQGRRVGKIRAIPGGALQRIRSLWRQHITGQPAVLLAQFVIAGQARPVPQGHRLTARVLVLQLKGLGKNETLYWKEPDEAPPAESPQAGASTKAR